MVLEMERGLAGKDSSIPMIPTYVSNQGTLPIGEPVVVIDAGGTNFRCALVSLEEDGFDIKYLGQHRTIAEASAVESPIRQETIGFPAHFFARAHNFKPPGRACQPEADSPMRT